MTIRKFVYIVLFSLLLASMTLGGASQFQSAAAMPASPVDETKVPHYFGPYPNWANSPFTLADATVQIGGNGSGAAATASVGANGAVTGFTITNPGSGYTTASVTIGGSGSGATASATVSASGVITSIVVDTAGGGYTSPAVSIAGGLPLTPASVTPMTSPVYQVTRGSATGGTFTLSVNGLITTAPIAFNALAADVQLALTTAGAGVSSVSGDGSISTPWVVTFTAAPASFTIDSALLTTGVPDAAVAPTADPAIFNVTIGNATGGTFTLSVDGLITTAPIAFNALAADVQLALTTAGAVVSSVSGDGSIGNPWVVTFTAAPASFTMDSALLTMGVLDASSSVAATNTYNVTIGSATGGTFTLSVDGLITTAPIAFNALASDVQLALTTAGAGVSSVTGVGSIATPWTIVFTVSPASLTIDGALLSQPSGGAAATAYGSVDSLTLVNAGVDYHMPTVAFDLPDDPNGTQPIAHVVCVEANCSNPNPDGTPGLVTIVDVVLDSPGSGYSKAPGVAILDGTQFDPIRPGGSGAVVVSTLKVDYVTVDNFGSGFVTAPGVTITDLNGAGTGASAHSTIDVGGVTAINLLTAGSGYMTTGGIKKFQDGLPVLCDPRAGWANCTDNNLGQHIPIAVPDTTTFSVANGFDVDTDYYVIAVVQHRERMSSSLPATGTLMREYVQLETAANFGFSKHVALQTDLPDGTSVPILMPDGSPAVAVDDPHFLGPVIVAQRDRAVRIVFYNLLPTGAEGDLFLPVDTTLMGSGMAPTGAADPADLASVMDEVRNPMCTDKYSNGMRDMCFTENRATLHLHGGVSPWISDGTPHQWITPANEATPWPQGVSVSAVPDMTRPDLGVPDCTGPNDGCMTFYYTNQQSARLMFYHDHAWGITRLNVYAGEAAGYLITDPTEQALVSSGIIPADQIPLVIQDRTFVPSAAQLAQQDPTWDSARWGGEGSLWYHHVYMPAQNPGDPGGMSAYGRWMYGPWFWPPATPIHGPIPNPYYAPNCNLDDPTTWQYQTDPFCEPQYIPGTPNISVGMEQFNDTPVVNGTAYPTVTLNPQSYRLRILNAANDRFWNLQWYIADPSTGTDSEVALNEAELLAAQSDPNIFPTPDISSDNGTDPSYSLPGPDWIQIGTEGGFLPAPVVIDGQQVTTWIIDPTRFDVGNVDKHSLLLAPAERADVIVDFSKFAGKTLILYNDAPAAFPARVASYDYYLGAPDMSPVGAPTILPGFGPNTRTIMQVKIAAGTPAPAFNLAALNTAFRHHADGSGVFEKGQHPIIVGQAAYNSAYGTSFAASSWCNAPGSTLTRCDGFARISDQGGDLLGFNTLKAPNAKMQIPLQPKALHDEMNASAFDEFGRMQANIGLEAVPATPALQNVILYPYVNPSTELIDATNLPMGDINVTPISNAADGTQIWKITHNGVDTHPIHFHLYDVQVLNRVTWDNIIIPTEASELGWKDTIRVSPLEDTIVALRPIIPTMPFELPNSVRELSPMLPDGSTIGFNNIDAAGNPTNAIVNQLVNFGWEYVYHCHILSHEEMDMMRPVSVALPPNVPINFSAVVSGKNKNTIVTLSWTDNSISETSYVVQRDDGAGYVDLTEFVVPLSPTSANANTKGTVYTYVDQNLDRKLVYAYRIVAKNRIGYGGQFMELTAQSMTTSIPIGFPPDAAPTNLTAVLQAGPQVALSFTDNSTNEVGFHIERSTDGVVFNQIATVPGLNNTGNISYIDNTVSAGPSDIVYSYRVTAYNAAGISAYSNVAAVTMPAIPVAPGNLTAVNGASSGNRRSVVLTWADLSNNETGFTIQRATNSTFSAGLNSVTVPAGSTTFTATSLSRNTAYYFRIRADNGTIISSAWVNAAPFPITTLP